MKTIEQIASQLSVDDAAELNNAIGELRLQITEGHRTALAQSASDQAAAVEAAKLAIQVNLDGIVAEAEPHFAAVMAAYPDDADVIGLGMALAKAKGHTSAARRAKIEADLAAAQAAAAAHAAALAALP